MSQIFNGRVPSRRTVEHKSSTSLVKETYLHSISALLRHNHGHERAGSQFDIRASPTKGLPILSMREQFKVSGQGRADEKKLVNYYQYTYRGCGGDAW